MPHRFEALIDDARKRTSRLEIRHVSASVAMLVELTPENLARTRVIATVDDAATIGATLDAIGAADPQPATQRSEQRWHLRFIDRDARPVLVVTSAIFAPRDGAIGAEHAVFSNGSLVHYLSERFDPADVPLLRS